MVSDLCIRFTGCRMTFTLRRSEVFTTDRTFFQKADDAFRTGNHVIDAFELKKVRKFGVYSRSGPLPEIPYAPAAHHVSDLHRKSVTKHGGRCGNAVKTECGSLVGLIGRLKVFLKARIVSTTQKILGTGVLFDHKPFNARVFNGVGKTS